MTDTPETQPVEGVEILKLLRKLDAQTRANGEALSTVLRELGNMHGTVQAVAESAGARHKVVSEQLADLGKQLAEVGEHVGSIGAVVADAAPLLQSAPARALRGGRKVADYLAGARRG